MDDHVQRMIAEGDALSERIGKLTAFVQTPTFAGLDATDQSLLLAQQSAMSGYLIILSMRLERAKQLALPL